MKKSSSDKILSEKHIKSKDEFKGKMEILSEKHIKSKDEFKGKMEGHSMKRSISDKILLLSPSPKNKHDENKNAKSNRFLITINVFGSTGPLRFVVSEDDIAATVIETALKRYAREGRLPVLGTDIKPFFLYTIDNGFNALESSEAIGSCGLRNFVLCKQMTESRPHDNTVHRKGKGWRACLQKVLIRVSRFRLIIKPILRANTNI